MNLMSNLHVVSSLHFFLGYCPVAEETVLIHSLIREKMTREQSIRFGMAINATHPGGVNLRRRPHRNATLPCVAREADYGMGGQ
jgi:hypothetical protein